MKLLFYGILMLFSVTTFAQDPLFSQYYSSPLYLNPAQAGSLGVPRLSINYRNQWPSLQSNFISFSASGDFYSDRFRSGFGIVALTDKQFLDLNKTEVGLVYAYHLKITDETSLSMGLQGSYANRTIGRSGLLFGDQINTDGTINPISGDPTSILIQNGPTRSYFHFGSGLALASPTYFLGLSVHNINQPNVSFTNNSRILERRFTVYGGYKFELGSNLMGSLNQNIEDVENIFLPSFIFRKQGPFTQLDLGAYITSTPATFGIWYRGLPFVQSEGGATNHDALVLVLGYSQSSFAIGYSYDMTISKLSNSGGSHEISLKYFFNNVRSDYSKYRKHKKQLSCPAF